MIFSLSCLLMATLSAFVYTVGALINIFYNYDNDTDHWPICSKLVDALAKLTEYDLKDCDEQQVVVIQHSLMLLSRFMQLIAKYLKAAHLSAGGNIDDQEDFGSLGGGLEEMMKWGSLRQGSHTHSNALLSLYSGVSGMSGSHSVQRYEERSAIFPSIGPSQSLTGLSQNTMNSLSSQLKSGIAVDDGATSESSLGSQKVINLPVPMIKQVECFFLLKDFEKMLKILGFQAFSVKISSILVKFRHFSEKLENLT